MNLSVSDKPLGPSTDQICRLCSGRFVTPFLRGRVRLYRCVACDAVFLDALPTSDEASNYYENEYLLNAADEVSDECRRMSRLPEQVRVIAHLKICKAPPASLIDIGCDKGFFLDEARRAGYVVTGVEPSRRARSYTSRIGLKIYADLAEVEGEFDIVTMQHSLEHFPDPPATLRTIYRLMKPGGVLLVRVPNFGSLSSQLRGARWCWFIPGAHYFHFTKKSLQHLLSGSGFSVQTLRSERPNNVLTMRAGALSEHVFNAYAQARGPSLRSRLSQLMEILTGVELYALAIRGD